MPGAALGLLGDFLGLYENQLYQNYALANSFGQGQLGRYFSPRELLGYGNEIRGKLAECRSSVGKMGKYLGTEEHGCYCIIRFTDL